MASRSFGAIGASTVVAAALVCGLTGAARGQGIANSQSFSGLPGQPPPFSKEQLDKSMQTGRMPPPALPGAAAKGAIAAPTKVPTLLSPTDELFDAINRGDIGTVRDALSRGADLSATNELGFTPLDLSIDLGRSDISFLLLSMRGAAPPAGKAGQVLQASGKATAPTAHTRAAQRERHPRQFTETAEASQAGQRNLPQLYAGNGGEPIPHAGFLGFGGR